MSNALNWFEIPTENLERATAFYNAVFGWDMTGSSMKIEEMGGMKMSVFPFQGVSGALVLGEYSQPSASGTVVYLNCGQDLAPMLGNVEAAGGKILFPKTIINEELGYFALFLDSEGNRVGLHSAH